MSQNLGESCVTKRQARRLKKGRVAILIAVVIFVIAGITYAFFSRDRHTGAGLTSPAKGKINLLVLGVDERDDDAGRSDTSFVITIDTDDPKVTMLSIPRDSWVKIPGHGWDKINHAYGFGSTKLSKASIENLLGIPIDYTIVVNFNGFVRMIDAVGGVTIDVDKRMKYSDPYDDDGGLYIDLQPGVQKLNGKTAIEYVRYRDEEGDIGRVVRQQKFVKALMKEFTKPQLFTRLPELVKQFSTAVRTDMPINEMLKLIPFVKDAAKSGLEAEWVSGTPIWIQDVSYWLLDIKELRFKVAQIQGIKVDERYRQATELLASEYIQSVPREIKVANVPPVIKNSLQKSSEAARKNPLEAEKIKTEPDGKFNTNPKTAAIANNNQNNHSAQEISEGLSHKNPTVSTTIKQ